MAATVNKETRGLFHCYAPDYEPVLMDADYEGFRMVFIKNVPNNFGRSAAGIMDAMGGVKGIHNPVDGKRYDSKSAYHRKLKETGHHVYEGKPSGKKLLNQGDHNVFKELKAAAIQHGL